MNFPSIDFFYTPSKYVREALEKPNHFFAMAFVITPALLGILLTIVNGLDLNPLEVIFRIFKSLISWATISIVFYMGYVIGRKKGFNYSFKGLASAFSFVWVGLLFVGIIMLVGFFFVSPAAKEIITVTQKDNLQINQSMSLINALEQKDSKTFGKLINQYNISNDSSIRLSKAFNNSSNGELFDFTPFLIISIIAGIIYLFSVIIVPYVIVRETFGWGPILNIFLLLLLGFVSLSIAGFINYEIIII